MLRNEDFIIASQQQCNRMKKDRRQRAIAQKAPLGVVLSFPFILTPNNYNFFSHHFIMLKVHCFHQFYMLQILITIYSMQGFAVIERIFLH